MLLRVTCHTQHVGPGSTFVAIQGDSQDGVQFIPEAIEKGATQLVVEEDTKLPSGLLELCLRNRIKITRCGNARQALAELSAHAYDYPARKLKVIAVTGTKGKTTSVYLLRDLLTACGKKVAMLTGVENCIGETCFKADLTTPQPDYLHWFFAQCVENGIEYVVMEASAQATTLHRLDGVQFDGFIFTNFSQEHAEFYADMDSYFADKCALVLRAKQGAPVVLNIDDSWVRPLRRTCKSVTIGTAESDYQFSLHESALSGVKLDLSYGAHTWSIRTHAVGGAYNAYNLVGVLGCLHQLNIPMNQLIDALKHVGAVPGRLERVPLSNGATAIVDYAHTPSSYEAVLSLLRESTKQLIVVFGCGGGKDPIKRPLMGGIAARYADLVVLTSDNPRTESNESIVADIQSGIGSNIQVYVEHDRSQAIAYAIAQAQSEAFVVILGKGPDEYQMIGTTKHFFSDRQEVDKFVSAR